MSDVNLQVRGIARRDFLKVAGLAGIAAVGSGLAAVRGGVAKAADAATKTVTDMSGVQVDVPSQLTKYADAWMGHAIVSIMLDGAKGMAVTACDPQAYQWMYKVCPAMSNAKLTKQNDFNYEELATLGVQVALTSSDQVRDKLASVNVPMVNCMFKDFEGMKQSVTLTADVFGGDAPAIAQKYNAELDKTLADVKAKTDPIAEADRPSVLHGNSVYTMTLDGTGTIIDDWISAAGGRNAVTESTTGNAQAKFSLEQIIAWDPDFIITGKPEEVDQIMGDPNWAALKAVKNKHVVVNPKGVFGWDRYGVEEILQLQWAAQLLHPDLFGDLDVKKAVKDFYQSYLNYTLTDADVELILAAKNPAGDGESKAASSGADAKKAASAQAAGSKADSAKAGSAKSGK